MCPSKSSAGCRAVSKVTSTNCWHGESSQQQKHGNLCCCARQSSPKIFLQKGKTRSSHWLSLTIWKAHRTYGFLTPLPQVLQFSVQTDYINKIAIGFVERHSTAPPGRVLTSCSAAPRPKGLMKQGNRTRAAPADTSDGKHEGTPWALSREWITTLSPPFCTRIKRETHSSNQNSTNKSYKAQIMKKKAVTQLCRIQIFALKWLWWVQIFCCK